MTLRRLAGQRILLLLAVTFLLAAILVEPVAEHPASSAQRVGPASTPITTLFDLCPMPIPLAFGPRAQADARATVAKAVPILYRQGIKTAGFRITALYPASSTASSDYGQLVAHACGHSAQQRTYVAELVFPAMLPSAALSQRTLFVSRFAMGWQVWAQYPPGPEPSASATGTTTSTLPTPGLTVDSIPPSQARGHIYLALGDSAPVWNGNASYPNYIAAHLRSSSKGLELVNLSVSGETSGSMLSGSSASSGSQQQRAVSFLKAHRSSVVLITIDIGGNDVLACGSGSNTDSCLQQVEATMTSNLTTILSQLRDAAGPSVPIVGMTYYDPYLGDWLAGGSARSTATGSVAYLLTLNNLLAKTYEAAGDRVADVQDAFQSTDLSTYVSSPWGQVPVAVERACTLLDMSCRVGQQTLGSDPTPPGAKVIAQAFEKTIGVIGVAR